jgi:hypothetical protein
MFLASAPLAGAQYYGQPNPCAPAYYGRGIVGGIIAQQNATACAQANANAAAEAQRRQAWSNYYAQQQAAQVQAQQQAQAEANAAAAAKQAAINQVRARAAREQAAEDEAARVAAQKAAEESPDNICRTPDMARLLMSGFNDLPTMKARDIEAVDIEHLTTVQYDTAHSKMVCHGRFVLNRGISLTGSMTYKPNVAGDMIYSWVTD